LKPRCALIACSTSAPDGDYSISSVLLTRGAAARLAELDRFIAGAAIDKAGRAVELPRRRPGAAEGVVGDPDLVSDLLDLIDEVAEAGKVAHNFSTSEVPRCARCTSFRLVHS